MKFLVLTDPNAVFEVWTARGLVILTAAHLAGQAWLDRKYVQRPARRRPTPRRGVQTGRIPVADVLARLDQPAP